MLSLQLDDARHVSIRPIVPSDLDALRTFFAALSRETRRLRFHSPIGELSEHLLREFTMANDRAHVAFVAEIRNGAVDPPTALDPPAMLDPPTTLVAEARYIRSADSESAEFALVVADNWRRIGLGTKLTRIMAQRARVTGVRRLCGDILEDNKAMRGFAHSLGGRLSRAIGCVRLSLEV
jgi:acetyltransferase